MKPIDLGCSYQYLSCRILLKSLVAQGGYRSAAQVIEFSLNDLIPKDWLRRVDTTAQRK